MSIYALESCRKEVPMLNSIAPELIRLLQAERERQIAEDRLAAAIRAARVRCGTVGGGTARLARALPFRAAPCCC